MDGHHDEFCIGLFVIFLQEYTTEREYIGRDPRIFLCRLLWVHLLTALAILTFLLVFLFSVKQVKSAYAR
jgi:hypothetical protein